MGNRTNQAELAKGLQLSDPELSPSSAGLASKQGYHIPDLGLIDAKNVLPTQEGYISYFGTDDKLETTPLLINIQEQITYKTLHGDVIQIAFAEKGLYFRSLAGDAAATLTNVPASGSSPEYDKLDLNDGKAAWHLILATIPLSPWKRWTFTLMQNALYIFQKGMDFIGKITSYKPGQIILEHLPPTYIISALERNTFTITSEDSSSDSDSFKAIQVTTNTGLDFGVQKIPVGSASEAARAIDAWKIAFEAIGFIAVTATETLRTEVAINTFIPFEGKTQAQVQDIIDATLFDAEDSDLKLEAFWRA